MISPLQGLQRENGDIVLTMERQYIYMMNAAKAVLYMLNYGCMMRVYSDVV